MKKLMKNKWYKEAEKIINSYDDKKAQQLIDEVIFKTKKLT